jgi:NRAMP (natural resistance-associated macrophage protein)-like metal ion transporter
MSVKKSKVKDYIDKIRPGVITGAADNDPSGIAAYSISGSQFGYSQNWIMLISIPMLIAVQGTVARIGVVTKKGLNEILKNEYGKTIAFGIFFILIICNTFTIGADMLATSASIDMFFTNNTFNTTYILIPLFMFLSYIIVFKNYKKIAKYMFWASLIFISYFITVILVHPNVWHVLQGSFIPNIGQFLNKNYALTATGILGTTISPYLLFWQQEEEQEEKRALSFAKKERKSISVGFIFSQLMTIFIMTAAGATLYKEHINILNSRYPAIATASVLRPLAGVVSEQLFAIGIISAGLIAIPVLAISSSYALTELTQHRSFLTHKFKERKLFYYIIVISLLSGFVFSIFKVNTIDALYYSQVLDGILTPIIVVFIIIIANNKRLMGGNTNKLFDNFFAILSLIIMVGASLLIFL